jgi:DNA ligase (NAD+)
MYAPDQIQQLEKMTSDLLSRIKSKGLGKDRLEDLRDVLRFHEYRYAILNDPLIADFEYDLLYKELE